MAKVWDTVVVGAGPGGATVAYHLACFGHEVLLLDQERFPRHKPCGGALSVKTTKFLPCKMETLDTNEIYGAVFSFKGRDPFRITAEKPIARLVARQNFDHCLVNMAVERGVRFIEGERVISIQKGSGGFQVATSKGAFYKAKYLVGADGPRGPCARFLNPGSYEPMGIALEEEVAIEQLGDMRFAYLDFGRFPWGYGWVFPKRGFSSVGCGAIPRRATIPLKSAFETMRRGYRFLPRDKGSTKAHLLPYFGDFPYTRARGRMLLVGDAARVMDPFLGEGIYYALASGTFAAEAVHAALQKGKRADHVYLARIQKELLGELRHAVRMADFIYPRLNLGYKVLKHSNELGLLYIKVMSGEVSYKDFNRYLFQSLKEVGKRRLKGLFSRNTERKP